MSGYVIRADASVTKRSAVRDTETSLQTLRMISVDS